MSRISDNYRELEPSAVPEIAARLENAWQNSTIPERQWNRAVSQELNELLQGRMLRVFESTMQLLRQIPNLGWPSLLDVGASCGFYSEIFRILEFDCDYTGLDYSPAYQRLAAKLFPGIRFEVGDARCLPYSFGSFNIVMSGGTLMHVYDYEAVIRECTRVSSKHVLFLRNPVLNDTPTRYFIKSAYEIECLEIWINENELFGLFDKYGLRLIDYQELDTNRKSDCIHRSYLLEK